MRACKHRASQQATTGINALKSYGYTRYLKDYIMIKLTNQALFIFTVSLCLLLLYQLSGMLTPFLLSALLAYLINPVVMKLEKWHIPHLLSVVGVFLFFFFGVGLILLITYPHIVNQLNSLIELIPDSIDWVQTIGIPKLLEFVNLESFKLSIPATLSKSTWVLTTFLQSGFVAIQLVTTIILTPVVTFYYLRDWNQILKNIRDTFPANYAPMIIEWFEDCDEILGAFFRGQFLVMLCLAVIYSVGLSLTGLKLGLVIGMIGGLLSIVPYLGSAFVLIASLSAGVVQFGFNESLLPIALVFAIGQGIEGYILTPYLIGERIGLHPVAVIFSIMAGGTLFGFFGVLLALPVAAMLVATLKFFARHAH